MSKFTAKVTQSCTQSCNIRTRTGLNDTYSSPPVKGAISIRSGPSTLLLKQHICFRHFYILSQGTCARSTLTVMDEILYSQFRFAIRKSNCFEINCSTKFNKTYSTIVHFLINKTKPIYNVACHVAVFAALSVAILCHKIKTNFAMLITTA